MKKIMITLLILSFFLWIVFSILLIRPSGIIDFFHKMMNLSLPTTTTEFAESISVLNIFFTSFALIMTTLTVLLQNKELKVSIETQKAQVNVLKDQISKQSISIKMQAKSFKLNYLINELGRMDNILGDLDKKNQVGTDLFKNTNNKKKRISNEIEEIITEIDTYSLNESENSI